jgi:4-hydroxybenzoyl-CoA thioesterase
MPRLQLDLPEQFRFASELTIYFGHINPGGHLDNAQLLVLYAEARRRYFADLGYAESDVEGLRTTMTDAAVIYRSEAFVGEVLVFQIAPSDFNKYGRDLLWLACEKKSGREVARGKSGLVFLQPGLRKPAPVPEAFRLRVAAD